MAGAIRRRKYVAEQSIIGDTNGANKLYIIEEGTVEVQSCSDSENQTVVHGGRECFGDLDGQHNQRAKAISDVEVATFLMHILMTLLPPNNNLTWHLCSVMPLAGRSIQPS